METSPVAQSNADPFRRVASPWHTLILLAAEGVMVYRGAMYADRMRAVVDPNRIQMYERTMLTEWLGFGFVILGVWLAGSPLRAVLGERWRSVGQVLRDIGIGVAFSIVSTILLLVFEPHPHGVGADRAVQFLLPHVSVEMVLWIALSVTAGICEETLYRGYLQRQFMALTKNVPAGILLSAAAFGAAHSYQGFHLAAVIGLEGAMLGALAHWRRSVRPGMIAHAWKDSLAPVLMAAMKH